MPVDYTRRQAGRFGDNNWGWERPSLSAVNTRGDPVCRADVAISTFRSTEFQGSRPQTRTPDVREGIVQHGSTESHGKIGTMRG